MLSQAPQPANSIPLGAGTTASPLCQEPNCTIMSLSSPSIKAYFGTGTKWCATPMVMTTLPLAVNYATPNALLCPTDPAPSVTKSVVVVQQATAQSVGYTVNGSHYTFTIPALPPPAKPIIWVGTCTMTEYSDLSFQSSSCVRTGP